jgi:pimeloyl-ACP methyl ester carboxylesterase
MTKEHDTKLEAATGYSKNGLPYFRMGSGQRIIVIFGGGPDFEHKPPSGFQLRMVSSSFKELAKEYTVYYVSRKGGLPAGYSTRNMSDDYAVMTKEELAGSVDIIGFSSGGPIAHHFAVDHPDLIRHLVLAETGYRLSEEGKEWTRYLGDLVRQGKWRKAAVFMVPAMYPKGLKKYIFKLFMWLFGKSMFSASGDPSDGLVEIEAEVNHDFTSEQLAEIKVPTLVIGGEEDKFYLNRETAEEIPNAKLILYEGFGHNALEDNKHQFQTDILAFLKENA